MLKKASAIFLVIMLAFGFLGLSAANFSVQAQDEFIEPYEDDFWEEDLFLEDTVTTTDEDAAEAFLAFMTAYMFGIICVSLVMYIIFSLVLFTIGKKLNVESGWMAWVPIVNFYYIVKLADMAGWMMILFFIPLVNYIYMVYCWMKIAERRGWESWLGLLTIVPVLNLIMPMYFAWGEPSGDSSTPVEAESAPKEVSDESSSPGM